MEIKDIQDKTIKAYLKEKEKELAFIVGFEESKKIMNEFYVPLINREPQFVVESFEQSHLQKICEAAKVSIDREYYRQVTEKLNSISMVMIGLLIASILMGIITIASAF